MKGRICLLYFILLLLLIRNLNADAQVSEVTLQQFLSENKLAAIPELKSPKDITSFYTANQYRPAWILNENTRERNTFFSLLDNAGSFGLDEKDYQYKFINACRRGSIQLQQLADSVDAEIRITDAAIHFYSDLVNGNTKPAFGYDGLKFSPGCNNIPALLAEYIQKNILPVLPEQLSNPLPEIQALQKRLLWFTGIQNESGFAEQPITSLKVNSANSPLMLKLYQLGFFDSVYKDQPDSVVKKKVKEAQRMFNLLPDGVLRNTIVKELNCPLSTRFRQLSLSINYYRWLSCLARNQSVIVVNLPAAYLKVYRNHFVITEMRMVVGKKSTPTPTLSSTINEVILYPYWHVPSSIATKEILPVLKRNPGYINAGNYQVLNRAGTIVDPYSVNWSALSAGNFPYLIRQSTGCDNALGLLKLNFYNPFSVYLHDTNSKNLFGLSKRFFSHGCMRLEKPMELGHLVLSRNSIAIDTLEQKGCLRNQSPITVHADEQMPVIVWYNPAGTDSKGQLLFFEDVYGKFNWGK